ncbi:MAG: RNA methyltransferase [bacterium]|nr:RNA methyltransferase [bacterium]
MSEADRASELIDFLGDFVTENKRGKIAEVLADRTDYVAVVLEDIYQPHNASAVLRTCECYGVQNVHIVENRNSYRVNPQVAMGSSKWLDLHRYREPERDNTAECLAALREQGYRIVATSPDTEQDRASHTPVDLPLDRPVAILYGTEEQGLTADALAAADCYLRLPQYGFTQSYNISVSVAITLTTLMARLRAAEFKGEWRLSEERRRALTLAFYRRIVTRHEALERRYHEALEPS